jgi:hypothetical protein
MLIFFAGAFCSCTIADPLFLENSGRISSVNYAANKIVGTWVHVNISPLRTNTQAMESKVYLDFRSNGKGKVREVALNRVDGGHLSAEATMRWIYNGGNLWKVTLPPSTEYRVTDSYLLRRTPEAYKEAKSILLRYYDGNLYDFESRQVLVPANMQSVSELANRMRRQTPVIRLNTDYKQ